MFKRVLAVIGIITTMVSAEIWEWGQNCVKNNYGRHKSEISGITCLTIAQLQCLNCEELFDDWWEACNRGYFHSFSNPRDCQTPCDNCGVKYSESNAFDCIVTDGSGTREGHKLGECGEDNFCRVDGCSFRGRTEHSLTFLGSVKIPATCQMRAIVDMRCGAWPCQKIVENVEHGSLAPHTNNTCGTKCDNCEKNNLPEHNWGEEPHNCLTECLNRGFPHWCWMRYSERGVDISEQGHNFTESVWTSVIASANCATNGIERGRCTNRHDIHDWWVCNIETFRPSVKKECVNADCNICSRGEITALQGIVGDLETQLGEDTLRLLGVISARDKTIKDLETDTTTLRRSVRNLTTANNKSLDSIEVLLDSIDVLLEKLKAATSINAAIIKSDNRQGIKFAENIVSDQAEISVVLPNNERAVETNVVIYDMTGNVVWASTGSATGLSWDLRNSAGRFVANGTYLVIAEVKSANGKIYAYSARLGVKR